VIEVVHIDVRSQEGRGFFCCEHLGQGGKRRERSLNKDVQTFCYKKKLRFKKNYGVPAGIRECWGSEQGWGAGAGAGAILFFLQEPEHFKKLKWSRSWSRSWHKLVRLQAPAVFKNFVKIMISDIILQAKKLFFGFSYIQILFRYTKINDL